MNHEIHALNADKETVKVLKTNASYNDYELACKNTKPIYHALAFIRYGKRGMTVLEILYK